MSRSNPDTPTPLGSWRNRRRVRRLKAAGLYTIKEVGDTCSLPQPVVAQLVPRTWTEGGWMYTAEQLAYAVHIAPDVREGRYMPPPSDHGEPRGNCLDDP
jgi:hypothetical protein